MAKSILIDQVEGQRPPILTKKIPKASTRRLISAIVLAPCYGSHSRFFWWRKKSITFQDPVFERMARFFAKEHSEFQRPNGLSSSAFMCLQRVPMEKTASV